MLDPQGSLQTADAGAGVAAGEQVGDAGARNVGQDRAGLGGGGGGGGGGEAHVRAGVEDARVRVRGEAARRQPLVAGNQTAARTTARARCEAAGAVVLPTAWRVQEHVVAVAVALAVLLGVVVVVGASVVDAVAAVDAGVVARVAVCVKRVVADVAVVALQQFPISMPRYEQDSAAAAVAEQAAAAAFVGVVGVVGVVVAAPPPWSGAAGQGFAARWHALPSTP